LPYRKGSMKHKFTKEMATLLIMFGLLLAMLIWAPKIKALRETPLHEPLVGELLPAPETIDSWVSEYSEKYGKTNSQRNHIKVLLHCLLFRESGYGSNKSHGDSGRAGGILQFWNETWNRMRNRMMRAGLVNEISSRYDEEESINTTAWALSEGYGNEWGPILRKECK